MDFSAILPGAGPGTPRAWSVTLGEQSWAGGHEGGSVGTTMEIWDPGDPPQPFSVWHERWENRPTGEQPRAAPTPRISHFAQRYEEALAREGIDIATHLPEMNRDGRIEWWFDGDTLDVGKFMGERAVEAMALAARTAREVGAVGFVGLEEEVPHGLEPVYPDAGLPDGTKRTLYVVVPELADDGPEQALRRAGWSEHRLGPTDPRLVAFLDRLTARFADLGIVPGASPTSGAPSPEDDELVSRQFTTRLPPSPHDWTVVFVEGGRSRLVVFTDPVDTKGEEIERAVRDVAEDLAVIDTRRVEVQSHFVAHLEPAALFHRTGTDTTVEPCPEEAASADGLAVLDAVRTRFATIGLRPTPGTETPDSVWFDTPRDRMTVELSASGDVVSVFGSETEPDLPAAVLRCLAEVRPECWGIVVMDARSAALVPEGVPHRLIG